MRTGASIRPAIRALAVAGFLALAVSLPLLPWIHDGALLGARDTVRLYAPLRPLVVESIRSFSLPLWNPFEGTGHPLLAEGIHGVLHPVSVVAAWLAPSSMNGLLVGYLVAAALGAWLLARSLGRSPAAAFLAAVAYALSGFVASMTDNLVFLAGSATLPWVLAALRACRLPGGAPVAAAGAAVAAALLAGDAQSSGVGVLVGLALAAEGGGRRALLRAGLGVGLGALLGAVQLVPALVHVQRTVRKLGLDDASRAQWALSAWRLPEFAIPGLFGSRTPAVAFPVFRALGGPTEYTIPFAASVHVGLVTLLLALRGIRADRTSRLLGVIALLLLWLALGPALSASQASALLPVWGKFRYAEKLVGPLTLCLALLAARGLDRELGTGRRSWVPAAVAAMLALTALLLWPGAVAGWVLGLAGHEEIAPAALDALREGFWIGLPFHAAAAAVLATTRLPTVPRGWLVAGITWGLAAVSLPWAIHPPPAGCEGPGWLARLRSDPPGPRIGTPTMREYLPAHPDAWRLTWCEYSTLAIPALNAPVGVDQLDLYTGLDPIRFARVWNALGEERWRHLRRFGLTHVVAAPPSGAADAKALSIAIDGGTPVTTAAGGRVTAWAVPHRAWALFARSASSASTPQPTLERLQAILAAGSDEVVIQADATPATAPGEVLSVRRGREELTVEARAAGPALLVVNDAWWPGWVARVDGSPVPILPADVLVRGVPFPAGRHVVEMSYQPPEVRWGLALSAAGLVGVAVLLVLGRRRAYPK